MVGYFLKGGNGFVKLNRIRDPGLEDNVYVILYSILYKTTLIYVISPVTLIHLSNTEIPCQYIISGGEEGRRGRRPSWIGVGVGRLLGVDPCIK